MPVAPLSEFTRRTQFRSLIRHWMRPAWDFLFPPGCLVCGRESPGEHKLCSDCDAKLHSDPRARCLRCAAPTGPHLDTTAGCLYCRNEKFAFRRVLAGGAYDGLLRQMILQAKTARGRPLTLLLADLFLDEYLSDLLTEPFNAIVPIPHDWRRRVWQVHVPSETFAERLASRLQQRYAPQILRKPRATSRQATAPPSIRRRQQRGAFVVPASCDLSGARLLLVDDVLTTGATCHAAAQALRAAGAADVVVAVLARGVGQRPR